MTDRLDSQIRALVIALVDQPTEPPPFPGGPVAGVPSPWAERRVWKTAIPAFLAAILIGVVSLIMFDRSSDPPISDVPAEDVVGQMVTFLNAGDVESVLALFDEDASCVSPGLPGCRNIVEFFVAAQAQVTFSGCEVVVDPFLNCDGYLHTSIHDALGITADSLATMPNFPPAFAVEDGRITRFNFSSPFTGDPGLDHQLWAYLREIEAPFADEDGVPLFAAEIVPEFIEAARAFASRD